MNILPSIHKCLKYLYPSALGFAVFAAGVALGQKSIGRLNHQHEEMMLDCISIKDSLEDEIKSRDSLVVELLNVRDLAIEHVNEAYNCDAPWEDSYNAMEADRLISKIYE